ncbi:hypothetical protein BDV12DRAFT_194289 [Aspergillus spectabilis]
MRTVSLSGSTPCLIAHSLIAANPTTQRPAIINKLCQRTVLLHSRESTTRASKITSKHVILYKLFSQLPCQTIVLCVTVVNLQRPIKATYWVFFFVGIFCFDKTGRRPPLIYGTIACAICFLCAAILQKDTTTDRAKTSLTFLFLYEAIFTIGWLAVPWRYVSEIMPFRYRTHLATIATASDLDPQLRRRAVYAGGH